MPYLYSLGVEGVRARADGTAMIWGQHEIDYYAQALCHNVYAAAAVKHAAEAADVPSHSPIRKTPISRLA